MTGLSVATVSRALADAPDISASTKARVSAIAKEVGYQPNRAGVRLRTGKTHVISFVLDLESDILGTRIHLIEGLMTGLAKSRYHLNITPSLPGEDDLAAVRYIVKSGSADGIVLSGIQPGDRRAAWLQKQNFPFVTHGRPNLARPNASVDFDNFAFGKEAAERLVQAGRQRLALIPPPVDYAYAHHMKEGFRSVLDAHDLVEVPVRDIHANSGLETISTEVERLLASRHRPDGFVCASFLSGLQAAAGADRAGLALKADLDVIAKDSIRVLGPIRPSLHTIPEDLRIAGRDIASLMLRLLEGEPPEALQILYGTGAPY